jgi:predicted metal-dependent hydrolase
MLGFSPKLPVSEEDRQWVDEGFRRLQKLVGRRRMLEAKVILPTAEDFPDPYDGTPAAAEMLFSRVCAYMRVERKSVELEVFPDEMQQLREILPYWRGDGAKRAAGMYVQHSRDDGNQQEHTAEECMVVAIRSTQLKDPLSLVATVAHELGHVILLGGRLLNPETSDHEPMTDLLTVFLGLGIFTANSAGRFKQYQEDRRQGWSMERLGYLPEEVFGYALARFATERGEHKAEWLKHLSTNVRSYFKQSLVWLVKNNPHIGWER